MSTCPITRRLTVTINTPEKAKRAKAARIWADSLRR